MRLRALVLIVVSLAGSAHAAPTFPVNTSRFDPYKNYRFLLVWNGRVIGAVDQVTPPAPNVIRKGVGRTKYEPITLERGLTQDAAFANWAAQTASAASHPASAPLLAKLQSDLMVQAVNPAGQTLSSFALHGCWVEEYHAGPGGVAAGVAIQRIKLECETYASNPLPSPHP